MGNNSFLNNVPDSLLCGKQLRSFKSELEKSRGNDMPAILFEMGNCSTVTSFAKLFPRTPRQRAQPLMNSTEV